MIETRVFRQSYAIFFILYIIELCHIFAFIPKYLVYKFIFKIFIKLIIKVFEKLKSANINFIKNLKPRVIKLITNSFE